MKIFETSTCDKKDADQYISIHDKGHSVKRKLYIQDDNGNTVVLKNEQIGKLYNAIKPPLKG